MTKNQSKKMFSVAGGSSGSFWTVLPLRLASLATVIVAMGLAGCSDWYGSSAVPVPPTDYYKKESPASLSIEPVQGVQGQSARDLWHDPTFQKQFVGSYGINAEIEPRITPEELEILEQIRPMMADNLPKARATLEKYIKSDSSAVLDMTLGNICFQQDKTDEALACFLRAVNKFPSFRRAWRNLGLTHARVGKYDEAIIDFTRMIELGGGDAYSYGLLGFAYASKEDYQAAEVAYRNALLLQPQNSEWRLGLTRCVFRQNKYEDAASLLNVLIARYPDKAEFWMLQAHTFVGMKKPLDAAVNLEMIDRLGKAKAETLYSLGDLYVGEDLPDRAVNAYCRAIDLEPSQPIARPLRAAEVLASRGLLSQSRQVATHIREVIDSQMQDADRSKLLKLEARLAMADGNGSDETAKILEEIVNLDPLDGEALMLLGQNSAKQNQPDRAIFWYERAEGIETFEAGAKLRHAQVLVGMRRYGEALPLLRRVQELKPREDLARYIEQVDRAARAKQ